MWSSNQPLKLCILWSSHCSPSALILLPELVFYQRFVKGLSKITTRMTKVVERKLRVHEMDQKHVMRVLVEEHIHPITWIDHQWTFKKRFQCVHKCYTKLSCKCGWNFFCGKPQVFFRTSHQYHLDFALQTFPMPLGSHIANSLGCKDSFSSLRSLLHHLVDIHTHMYVQFLKILSSIKIASQTPKDHCSYLRLCWNMPFRVWSLLFISLVVIYGCPFQVSHGLLILVVKLV